MRGEATMTAQCRQCAEQLASTARFCPFCGASARGSKMLVDPLLGRTIAGSYVILELAGVGGMGRVYRAEQTALGRAVAIKVIHPNLLATEEFANRFYVEARAASRLNHPNSVSIIDFGRTDDGIVYLVMEYLRGQSLSQLTAQEGLLPIPRAGQIMLDVLAALGEAHANGVVHRDLKPENIMIERLKSGADLVKVVDFGIAKFADGQSSSTTSPGVVCGTPEYMSPEHGRGEQVDGRSDVYAAGVVLFELLTGRVPYTAESAADLLIKHCQAKIPNLASMAPQRSIPAAFSAIAKRALAKRPDARFQSVSEMADSLREVLEQLRARSTLSVCGSCGGRTLSSEPLCGECGATLGDSLSPARPSLAPGRVVEHGPLLGREAELARIDALRSAESGGPTLLNLVGELGTGHTRLLDEVARRARAAKNLVLLAGPHDSGAQPPYFAIRTLFAALAGVAGASIEQLIEAGRPGDRLALAGLRELQAPQGTGEPLRARTCAVAHALAAALKGALARGPAGRRALLVIDDLHRCDALTAAVLGDLPAQLASTPVLLIGVSVAPSPALLARDAQVVGLEGLNEHDARRLLDGLPLDAAGAASDRASAARLLPLYVEQLRRLKLTLADARPFRLDDIVALRVQSLTAPAQRLLQAAAVLGVRSRRSDWLAIVQPQDMDGREELSDSGLIAEHGELVEIAHPFIRDLVESSIPAVARRELHARALAGAAVQDAPLEVRAEHAYRGAELQVALPLLREVGRAAQRRGDPHAAAVAFQRALELLRRDALVSADESTWHAMAEVSRELAAALVEQEDLMGADGVLREGLEFCHARDDTRAQLLIDLADVLRRRQRCRDAARLTAQVLEVASTRKDTRCQARSQLVIAALRKAEGDAPGELAALTSAHALLCESEAPPLELAALTLEIAAAMLAAGDQSGALLAVASAESLVPASVAPAIAARARILRAQAAERCERRDPALALYDEALAFAEEAGDVVLVDSVKAARQHCSRMPPRQSLRTAS